MVQFALTNQEFQFLFNLILTICAGFLIGVERESRGKDAGISTNIFVIAGAMLFTYLSLVMEAGDVKIAAQIVTGIGFLGAGIILKEGEKVINLTTAASLWFSGAIGMAIGFGYYHVAVFSTIATIFIPRIPHIHKSSPESIHHNLTKSKRR